MLLLLTEYLAKFYSGFHVFQYLTLRGILAAMTTLAMSLLIGPRMIALLSHYQIGQVVRNDGPQSHLQKTGTPTMGGGLIWSPWLSGRCCGRTSPAASSGCCSERRWRSA